MKIATRYIDKKRNETHANTVYTAQIEFTVSDLEMEDWILFEPFISDWFPYIMAEIEADRLGKTIPECECCGDRKC